MPIRHEDPRLQAAAERLHDASLRVERHAGCGVEDRRAFANRADERSIAREFEERMIAPVQKKDVSLRVEGHAHGFRRPDVAGPLEEVLLDVEAELRRRRRSARSLAGAAACLSGERDAKSPRSCRNRRRIHHPTNTSTIPLCPSRAPRYRRSPET